MTGAVSVDAGLAQWFCSESGTVGEGRGCYRLLCCAVGCVVWVRVSECHGDHCASGWNLIAGFSLSGGVLFPLFPLFCAAASNYGI